MAKRDLVIHNFGWKLLSLFLAGLMWMAIWTTLEKDQQKATLLQESPVVSTRNFPVSIAVLNRAANASMFFVTPSTAEIELSGKAADLEKLQAIQISAFVDVTDAPNEKQFRKSILVQVPNNFKIVNVTPATAGVERIPPLK